MIDVGNIRGAVELGRISHIGVGDASSKGRGKGSGNKNEVGS